MRNLKKGEQVMSTGDQWIDYGAYGKVTSDQETDSVMITWSPHPEGRKPKMLISLYHSPFDLVLAGTVGDPNFEFKRRKQT